MLPGARVAVAGRLVVDQTPMTRVRIVGAGRLWPVARQLADRHLDRERVDVQAGRAVLDAARADAEQVEHREVDEEALVTLTGEDADAGRRQLLHAAGERRVVRERARADVRRRDGKAPGQLARRAGAARAVDAQQAIELPHVEVRIVDATSPVRCA